MSPRRCSNKKYKALIVPKEMELKWNPIMIDDKLIFNFLALSFDYPIPLPLGGLVESYLGQAKTNPEWYLKPSNWMLLPPFQLMTHPEWANHLWNGRVSALTNDVKMKARTMRAPNVQNSKCFLHAERNLNRSSNIQDNRCNIFIDQRVFKECAQSIPESMEPYSRPLSSWRLRDFPCLQTMGLVFRVRLKWQ